jgi:hypothetical protein
VINCNYIRISSLRILLDSRGIISTGNSVNLNMPDRQFMRNSRHFGLLRPRQVDARPIGFPFTRLWDTTGGQSRGKVLTSFGAWPRTSSPAATGIGSPASRKPGNSPVVAPLF